MRRLIAFSCAFSAAVTPVALVPRAIGGESPAAYIKREVLGVFEKCRDAVVRIETRDDHGRLAGTGFFIAPDGTLLTSYTLGAGDDPWIHFRGSKMRANVLLADPRSGIAILQADAETPFLVTGSSSGLDAASPVILVGYPLDFDVSPAFGVVSGFSMGTGDRLFATRHIRASIAVQGGQGGSPLLDLDGRVVGIVIASVPGGGGAFALPVEAVEKIRRDFVRFGEARPGFFGAKVGKRVPAEDGHEAFVEEIDEAGPAFAAGVRPGDVVLEFAGRPIRSREDVMDASFFTSAGDSVRATMLRGGKIIGVEITAALHPAAGVAVAPRNAPISSVVLPVATP